VQFDPPFNAPAPEHLSEVIAKPAVGFTATTVRANEPTFVTVTVCAALVPPLFCVPKSSDDGEEVAVFTSVPLPLRSMVWDPDDELSEIVIDAPIDPEIVGENVICTLQFEPGATAALQSFVCAKSGSPVTELVVAMIEPICRDWVLDWALVMVTESGALVVPTV
jgi:hypothetical protein